jgi:hypothetical protein
MLLKMVFRFKLWMEKFRWNDLEHFRSWEVGRRNFEPPPTAESDGSFSWTGMLRAEFGEKGKRKEPIRSDQSATIVQACPHLIKTFSLSSETLQTNPHSRKKNRVIRNCDVIRARFCDLEEFLYQSAESNFFF